MEKKYKTKDYLASRIISYGKELESKEYDRVYYRTNEDLQELCRGVEIEGKDVYSVLASSDHIFNARYLKAKSVDAFDINRLTIYYFYLRLWTLKYKNELYPNILGHNHRWLGELLKQVKPKNEMEQIALTHFKKHYITDTNFSNLFFLLDSQPTGYTCFQTPEDLRDCLSPELDFQRIDLFEEQEVKKDYDVIFISNILDRSRKDLNKTTTAAENLSQMTRKDGVVLCSNLIFRRMEDLEREREIFSPYFEKEQKGHSYVYHRK